MPAKVRTLLALLICLILLGAFLAQGAAFIQANSQTFDEAAHITAGYSFLATKDYRLYQEHPPLIRELCALPVYLGYHLAFKPALALWQQAEMWAISRDFLFRAPVPAQQIVTAARWPNLLLGTLLVALVGWWAYRAWGVSAAVVGTALAALEPNLVAHASLVGTDLGITLFTFLAVYLLWEHGRVGSTWLLAGVGMATGLALTTKFSAVLLVALLPVLLIADAIKKRSGVIFRPACEAGGPENDSRPLFYQGVVLAILAALVFPLAYQWQGVPWLNGFLWQIRKLGTGHDAFFLGEYSQQGWWSYFPVAFLIKTPLGTLILLLASVLLLRKGKALGRRDALFLVLPVLAFTAATMRSKVDVGIRYLLPIYPFLFVLAARVATISWRPAWLGPILLGLPLLLNAVSVLRIVPHHLAYFNELIGGPAEGYRYLGDSNIDWGQDLIGLKAYLERENVPMLYLSYFGTALPEGYGIRYQEAPACSPVTWPKRVSQELPAGMDRELLAISVTCLQGTYFQNKDLYRWLYHRKPVATVGYSIQVYDLTGDAEAHLQMAEVYERCGWPGLAAAERRRAGE